MKKKINLKYLDFVDRGNEGLWVNYNTNKEEKVNNDLLFPELNDLCSCSSNDVIFTIPKSLHESFYPTMEPIVQGYYLEKNLEKAIEPPNPYEIEISPISQKDLKAISNLLSNEYGYIDSNNYTSRELTKVFSNFYGKYLEKISGVIKVGNVIAGIVVCMERDGFPYILHLAVNKEYRGQALGKSLIEFTEYNSKRLGYAKIWFFVNKNNLNVLRIFRKNGYETMGEENLIYKISCILKK